MRVPQVSERIKEAPAQALRGVFAGIGQLLLVTDKLRNKAPAERDVARARTPRTADTVTDATVTSRAGKTAATAGAQATPAAAAPAEPAATRRAPAKPATAKPAAKPANPKPAAKPANPKPAAKPATAKPATAKPATAKPAARHSAAKPAVAGPGGEAPAPPKPQSIRDFDKTGNVRLLGGEDGGSVLGAAAPPATAEPVTAPEPVSAPADGAPPLPNYDELSMASLRARLRNLDVAQVRELADYERGHAARDDVLAMFERRIAKLEAESSEAGA